MYVTIWSKGSQNDSWVIERTHTLEYIRVMFNYDLSIGDTITINKRIYGIFAEGVNPAALPCS
jgi:hypothetical protein